MSSYRLGVDIGGTFTDFALFDESKRIISVLKISSTVTRPAEAVFSGVRALEADRGVAASTIQSFIHGTTLAVNTIIQRNGARVALLVTQGFRDILNIGRGRLPDVFSFDAEIPTPLVPRSCVVEVDERCLANGRIIRAVSKKAIVDQLRALVAQGVEAVAVGFLHSYCNPTNEKIVKQIAASVAPELYVSLSSESWPQMREYERTLVGVINAYVGRKMGAYFANLQSGLVEAGLIGPVLTTRSNGGVMTAQEAAKRPVETLLSGPAAGVIGAQFVAASAGYKKVITLDMGGTSADVGVIDNEPQYSTENYVGDFPIIMPAIDVTSIGAGGGSIAWVDSHRVLKVGPRSAGAVPGPACYGLGGDEATVTDAYVYLGIVDPSGFAGGSVGIDPALAEEAIGRLSKRVGLDSQETAESILRVATSHMYAALLPLLARKGVDYDEFALLPFGGAGPTHGFLVARELGIRRVIVPPHPGVLCAMGSLVADAKRDFVRHIHRSFDQSSVRSMIRTISPARRDLTQECENWLKSQRSDFVRTRIDWALDMRFLGQSFEITVPIREAVLAEDSGASLLAAFNAAYKRTYGYVDLENKIEVLVLRATALGIIRKPKLRVSKTPTGDSAQRKTGQTRRIFLDGRRQTARVYNRDDLAHRSRIHGPAIVQQYDTTTFVPSRFTVTVDHLGNLIGEANNAQ
jgi:N-methylhydantoinase A